MVYHRRRGTAIVDTPKGILVVSESGRGYLLPGGNARKGESRRKAAIRELEEETGLKATDVSYLFEIKGGIHKNRKGHSFRTAHKVFLVKTIGTAKPKGEIKNLTYVNDSDSLDLSRSTRRIIERYNEIKSLTLSKKIFRKIKRRWKRIVRKIRKSLTFWNEIEKPPKWVEKKYLKWHEKDHTGVPTTLYFKGKTFLYKVKLDEQLISRHWYRKKRRK